MSCCGKKREELRQRRTMSVLPVSQAPTPPCAHTAVAFKGAGSYLVTGEHSRQVYRFSEMQPVQDVDLLDAPALLKTGLFQATNRA